MARLSIIVGLMALLVACEGRDPDDGFGQTEYEAIAKTITADADWSAAEKITVEITEFNFSPNNLEFKIDRPYELVLVNNGVSYHTFAAENFFDAIAVWQLKDEGGYVEFPYLAQVSLLPKSSKTLLFVPMRPGRYELKSAVLFYSVAGMRGDITIR